MVKLSDNGFHALKVTFANEIGRLALELDVDPVALAAAEQPVATAAAPVGGKGRLGGMVSNGHLVPPSY